MWRTARQRGCLAQSSGKEAVSETRTSRPNKKLEGQTTERATQARRCRVKNARWWRPCNVQRALAALVRIEGGGEPCDCGSERAACHYGAAYAANSRPTQQGDTNRLPIPALPPQIERHRTNTLSLPLSGGGRVNRPRPATVLQPPFCLQSLASARRSAILSAKGCASWPTEAP